MREDEKFILDIMAKEQAEVVLEIGCGYPFNLIHLLHAKESILCVGVDLIKKEDVVGQGDAIQRIQKKVGDEITSVEDKIWKLDSSKRFYNSYKEYVSVCLYDEPLEQDLFLSKLKMCFDMNVQEFLEINPFKRRKFDLIIISKVLSHIEPEDERNADWIYNRLINILQPGGLIYVRVNSEDYKVKEGSSVRRNYGPAKRKILREHSDLEIVVSSKEFRELDTSEGKLFRTHTFVGRKRQEAI